MVVSEREEELLVPFMDTGIGIPLDYVGQDSALSSRVRQRSGGTELRLSFAQTLIKGSRWEHFR